MTSTSKSVKRLNCFLASHEEMARRKENEVNEDMERETDAYFESIEKFFYSRDILKGHWSKCIELKGDYVEE